MWLCLARSRGCWLNGLHQIPSVSWISHHSLHFHTYQIISLVRGIMCPLYCYYKLWGDGIGGRGGGGRVADSYQGVGGGTGGWYYVKVFFTCAFVFCSLTSSVSFFKWLEHDSCCVCFCVCCFSSLSPVPLTMSYWGIENVEPAMWNYL